MASTKSLCCFAIAVALVLSAVATTTRVIVRPVNAVQTFNVLIFDLAFNPQNLTIQAGDTVRWINNDSLIYTIWFVKADDNTTYTNAGTEGLSDPILPMASWSQTFNELVTIQYYSFERLWITGFITVTPPVPPVASFVYAPSTPLAGQIVTFDASSSYDPDGTITQYSWNFGDGVEVNETDPVSTHTYATVGTYTVDLTITDDDEQTDTASAAVVVYPIIHDVAIVSITPSPTQVTVGQNVSITVVARNNGNVSETFNVAAYFNDTEIDTQEVANLAAYSTRSLSFTWNTAGVAEGEYTIKAVADTVSGETNQADNTGTATTKVKVTSPPPLIPIEVIAIIIIVAIVIIGALVYVYLRRRKTRTTT